MEPVRIFFLTLGTVIIVITLLTNLFAFTTFIFGTATPFISMVATAGLFVGLAIIVIGLFKRGDENNYYI
ncbi:MAG: hypothetical protein MUO73_03465 [Thermoplasmata archaeon]|nr:hypothetical protein [Thermoplasmata archaeon]